MNYDKIIFMNEDLNQALIASQAIVEKILVLMGISAHTLSKKEVGNIVVAIKTADAGILIGKDGRNLNALQEITRAIFFKKTNLKKKVIVDVNEYRKRREEVITKIAKEAADQAAKIKKEVALSPMPSFERYFVHSFLQNDHRVTTMSQGEGNNRCVVVIPNE